MSRLLATGDNQITQTYEEHAAKVGLGNAWAEGIDIVKDKYLTDSIKAHSSGKVIKVMSEMRGYGHDKEGMGYGNYVMVEHENRYVTLYAHLNSVKVKEGQEIKKGTILGYMGNTGISCGAHLHFEVRQYNIAEPTAGLHNKKCFDFINPTPYLEADLPKPSLIENRYKVIVDGRQTGAYTYIENAVRAADEKHGTIYDSVTNVTIFPSNIPKDNIEDYESNTIANRFRVIKKGKQYGAYTTYKYAVRNADKIKGEIVDRKTNQTIYKA